MKLTNTYTKKDVTKAAYSYLYSVSNLVMNRKPSFDMRYNFSKELALEIQKLAHALNKSEALSKMKKRRANKPVAFTNILQNPLVIDLIKNGHEVKHFNQRVVQFYGGRNHHAKSSVDEKVISIFAKRK